MADTKSVKTEIYPEIPKTIPPEDVIDAKPLVEMNAERGRSGTMITGGYIVEEDYNKIWDTRQRFDVIEQMRRGDATVKSSLQAINLPILAADWDIKAASDDPIDVEIAAFCHHNLMERLSFFDFLRQGLTMLPFGFSVFEKVFEVIEWNGKEYVGLKKLQFMKQWTVLKWQTPAGNLGITQMLKSGPSNIPIPWWKLVVFTNEREGDNYQGISILRSAYQHWDIKHKLYLIDALSIEKQGLGIPYLTTPAGASEQDRGRAREIARNMRANKQAFVDMPEGFSIDFIDMKAHTTKDAHPSIAHHNREILLNVLVQFMDLGSGGRSGGGGGAKALSEDQSRMFQLSLEAIAKNISETIYSTILQDLVKLNYPGHKVPQLVFGRFNDENIAELSNALNLLMQVGAVHPDPTLEEWIRKALKAPDLPDLLKQKLNEMMQNIDTTNEDASTLNKGEDLNSAQEKNKAPKNTLPDSETKQTDTTQTKEAKPVQDEPTATKKTAVQASEMIESVKHFRTYLDKAIKNLDAATPA